MELSERIIATLETEGCISVYEETLGAHATLSLRTTVSPIAIVVTDGCLEVTYNDITQQLKSGNRLDILADTTYSIIAGKSGCNYVVGEF